MIKTATEILGFGKKELWGSPTIHGKPDNLLRRLTEPFKEKIGKFFNAIEADALFCKDCGRHFKTHGGLISHYSRYHEHDKRKK